MSRSAIFVAGFVAACIFSDASLEGSIEGFIYVAAFWLAGWSIDKLVGAGWTGRGK